MTDDYEARMTFTEHLGELRTRIIRSAIAIVIGLVLCYFFSNQIFYVLTQPLQGDPEAPDAPIWQTMNVFEAVMVKLKLATYGGIACVLPYLVYQICAFIFPGLRPTEKKAARIMIFGCSILAIVGVSVAYFGIFPVVMPFLMSWAPEGVTSVLRMNENVTIIIKALLVFALVFQFPMVVLILVYLDLLTPALLKSYRRMAIVGMAVMAAMLTPPDPWTMLIMLVPLVLLYETSVILSHLVVRSKKKKAEADGS